MGGVPLQPDRQGGGRIANISPTFNQVEKTVSLNVKDLTLRPRFYTQILVRPGKTRPFERMVSHGVSNIWEKAIV
jgi:tRNA A58 N-methylase Trm61